MITTEGAPGCQGKWPDRGIRCRSGPLERPEALRSPLMASREPRRLLSSTPFQSSSGCRFRARHNSGECRSMNRSLSFAPGIVIGLMMLASSPSPSVAAQKHHPHHTHHLLVQPRSSGYGSASALGQQLSPEAAALRDAQKFWPGTYLCDDGGYRIRPCYLGDGSRGGR